MLVSSTRGKKLAEIAYDDEGVKKKWYQSRDLRMTMYSPTGQRLLRIERNGQRGHGNATVSLFKQSDDFNDKTPIGGIVMSRGIGSMYKLYGGTMAWTSANSNPFAKIPMHSRRFPITDAKWNTLCTVQTLARRWVSPILTNKLVVKKTNQYRCIASKV